MNAESSVIVAERMEKRSPAVIAQPATTPMQMLAIAVNQGADIEKLTQLMALQERWEASEARKAYVAAMAAFKAEPMRILKTRKVDIPGGAKFSHATLADVVDGVVASLSQHGLSHKWEISQQDRLVTVTCVLTHELGHSERTTLTGAPDDSGKKNGIQQIASTVTYLERYTLMAACGLAASDMDDDGRKAGGTGERISEKQLDDLKALITEHNGNESKLLAYFKIGNFAEMPAKNYDAACKQIRAFAQARRERTLP